jgi:hypothetical protein
VGGKVKFKLWLKKALKEVYEVSYLKLVIGPAPYDHSESTDDEVAGSGYRSGVGEEIKKDLKKDSEED